MIASIMAAAVVASAHADIPVITGTRLVGKTCIVTARDQAGPFEVVVSWAACREVKVALTSIADLAETDQLDDLDCKDVAVIARSNRGHLISA
jgi:hypothetical protein